MRMKYTVKNISEHSGLAMQTIREYADRGMIGVNVDGQNRYRYFEANALNQTGAARRLRMMGFSLDETEEILVSVSCERYEEMLDELIERQQAMLEYHKELMDMLGHHRQITQLIRQNSSEGWLEEIPAMYCLDYRKNHTLMCSDEHSRQLLNQWMAHAAFTRNYSPYPAELLMGGEADHVIGLIIPERCGKYVPLESPVYRREGGLHACFVIRHDDRMNILPDGPAPILHFLEENALEACAQPYFIGNIPFAENGEKQFYATLYIPVKKQTRKKLE